MIHDNPTLVVQPCRNGECPEAPAPKAQSTEEIARARFSNPDVRVNGSYSSYKGALEGIAQRIAKDLDWDSQLGQERASAARSVGISALYWMLDGVSHEALDEDLDAALAYVRGD